MAEEGRTGFTTGFGMGVGFVVAIIVTIVVTCVGGVLLLGSLGAARKSAIELHDRKEAQRLAPHQDQDLESGPEAPEVVPIIPTRLRGETLAYGYRLKGWGPTDPPEEVLPGVFFRGATFTRDMQHFYTRVSWRASFDNGGEQRRINVRIAGTDADGSVIWRPREHELGGVVGVLNRGATVLTGQFRIERDDEAAVKGFVLEVFRD